VVEGQLQTPHGGKLVDLMAPADQHAQLKASASRTVELSDRNACDVELLIVGWAFLAHPALSVNGVRLALCGSAMQRPQRQPAVVRLHC
jgi:PUA-like domain